MRLASAAATALPATQLPLLRKVTLTSSHKPSGRKGREPIHAKWGGEHVLLGWKFIRRRLSTGQRSRHDKAAPHSRPRNGTAGRYIANHPSRQSLAIYQAMSEVSSFFYKAEQAAEAIEHARASRKAILIFIDGMYFDLRWRSHRPPSSQRAVDDLNWSNSDSHGHVVSKLNVRCEDQPTWIFGDKKRARLTCA